jgi:hypothetical protein
MSANQDKVPCTPTVKHVSKLDENGKKSFEDQTGRHVVAVLSQYS